MATAVSLLVTLVVLLGAAPGGTWPLAPRPPVLRGFDPPASPWGAGHRGVDLLGHRGQVVRAARAGRITFAGRLAGRGVVVVEHGALRTTYEPVTPSVTVGDPVAEGQPIGSLQAARSHCAPRVCLHWGLLRDRVYLNPLLLVGGGPVRLLPLRGASPAGAGPPSTSRSALGPAQSTGAGGAGRAAARAGLP